MLPVKDIGTGESSGSRKITLLILVLIALVGANLVTQIALVVKLGNAFEKVNSVAAASRSAATVTSVKSAFLGPAGVGKRDEALSFTFMGIEAALAMANSDRTIMQELRDALYAADIGTLAGSILKLNDAMSEVYRAHGSSPLSNSLPLLQRLSNITSPATKPAGDSFIGSIMKSIIDLVVASLEPQAVKDAVVALLDRVRAIRASQSLAPFAYPNISPRNMIFGLDFGSLLATCQPVFNPVNQTFEPQTQCRLGFDDLRGFEDILNDIINKIKV